MIYPIMKSLRTLFVVVLMLVFCCSAVFAQEVEVTADFDQEAASKKALERLKEIEPDLEIDFLEQAIEPLDFGQANWHTHWITGDAFTPLFTYGRMYWTNGYFYRDTGSSWYTAQIKLPSGSRIGRIALYSYDNTNLADYNIFWWVIRYNTDNNSVATISTHQTYGSPGFNITYTDYSNLIFENKNQYTIYLEIPYIPATKTHLAWKGVRISYVRTISPAPATATFSDVPVGSTFHQHIEALVRSGITGGVGGGLYAPSAYVTRGQMAAFLSRALGLHHPDPW